MKKTNHSTNCIFCKIINGELNSWIVYQDEIVIVILDVMPLSKGHCLVITKRCQPNLLQLNKEELLHIQKATQIVTDKLQVQLQPQGFNFINNFNSIAGQEINHYHLHIIPKYNLEDGFI